MTDPRLENLIRLENPDREARTRVIGVWPGAKDGAFHGALQITKGAAEQFLSNAFDVRQNRHYGPVEAGRRIREAAGPVLGRLNAAAKTVREQGAALADQLRAASATPGYDKTGNWQPIFDLRVIDAWRATTPHEKAGVLRSMMREPMAHLELADSLQRVPLPISGISWAERNALRVGLFKQLRSDEYLALDGAREQHRVAFAAVREAVAAIREAGAATDDLRTHAGEAVDLALTGEHVTWGEMPIEAA